MINTFSPLRASHCLSAPAQTCHQFSDLPSASLVFLTCMYPSVHPCSFLEKRETQQGKKGTEREEIGGFGVGGGGGGDWVMGSCPQIHPNFSVFLPTYFRTSVLPYFHPSFDPTGSYKTCFGSPPTHPLELRTWESWSPRARMGVLWESWSRFGGTGASGETWRNRCPPPPPPPLTGATRAS